MGEAREDQLTPVLFAKSNEEASWYCALLEDVNIPAMVGVETGGASKRLGVPVLVPESCHEWSSEVLASVQADWSDQDYDEEDEEDEDDDDDDVFSDDPDNEELDDDDDDEFVDDDFDDE